MSGIKSHNRVSSRFLFPIWLTGPWGWLGIISILYAFINLAWTYFHWGDSEQIVLIANLSTFFPGLVAVATAWRVAAEKELSASLRRAWFILGVSFLMVLLGNVLWAYLEVVLAVEPFPSLADVFYLVFYPLALWGLLGMPSMSQNRRERFTLSLDLLSILTAAGMFVGYYIIVPTAAVSSNDLLTQLIAPAYPLGSLLVLGGIFAVLYRPASPDTQSALILLLVGMVFFVGGDFAFGYTSLTGTYAVGGWTDASWNVAQVFFALAALRKMVQRPSTAAQREWVARLNRFAGCLPPLAVALGYGLVFYALIVHYSVTAEWLMAGALLLTLVIIARQIVSPAFAHLPVRGKMILTFIMVSVLSVSLVSAAAYLTIRSNLEAVVGDGLKADVEVRAETLGNELSKQLDLMEGFVLGETIEQGASAADASYSGDPNVIEIQLQAQELAWQSASDSAPLVQHVLHNPQAKELREFLLNFPTYTDLLLTDTYGATFAATQRPANYDQSMQAWWQAAYNHGQGAVYVGQPAFDPTTQALSVIIAVPVHADQRPEVVGVLRANYNLHNILNVLTAVNHESTQRGFCVLLPGGQLITAGGQIQSLDAETMARLKAGQVANYAEIHFMESLQLVSQAHVISSDPANAEIFNTLNWRLITHEEPAIAFAPLHSAWRTALLATFLVLVLTSSVAVILAQVLMAPISRLTQVAAQIAAGDLSTKAQVESRDEIGTLASTFNSMLDGLAQAQQEVQASEALYRSLVDYSPDMIAVHSGGKVLFINPAGVKLLAANNAHELIGQPTVNIIPAHEPEERQKVAEPITGERAPLRQQKMHRLDGTTFEAEFRAIPISYAGQVATQFVIRDITERKEAETKIHQLLAEVARQRGDLEIRVAQRTDELNTVNVRLQAELSERQRLVQSLQDSETRFRMLFAASPDAILLIDPNDADGSWQIVDCNEVACRMNGYTRAELIGQSIDILNATTGSPAERQAYLEDVREQGVLHYEALHRHKEGYIFPVEVSTSLITFGGRELILGIDRDITERKQSEVILRESKEVAEAASRAKSEFLSRMSHELRTPMNAILGFAQLLTMSRKEPLSTVQNERVEQIVKGGQHLLSLINEILDISRIEAGRLQISPEPVSLGESIQEALDLTEPLAASRAIQLHFHLEAGLHPYGLADRQRLKQVLLNLLSNAVKYNREGGSVTLTCEPTQTEHPAWRISISDTGSGIASEDLKHLFIPFERLKADLTAVEGTGLGLALAKRLVELMDGQIGVDSVLGQGSTFWIELPVAESQLDHLKRVTGPAPLSGIATSARTILYIEDNIANFELVRQILADYSHIELLCAIDSEGGLRLAHQRQPDLILLDLHLGARDGSEVLNLLKRADQTAAIPVIMVSADATPGQIERLLAMGAHAYLTKPLDVQHLLQIIEELLSKEINYDLQPQP